MKAAKKVVDMIYEAGTQVKMAIRMSNTEVDKIRDLKMRKDEEEHKVDNRKDEKVRKDAQVQVLQGELQELIQFNKQHHELPEEAELSRLRLQYEELMMQREEQTDKLEMHKAKNDDLKDAEKSQEAVTTTLNNEICESNEKIKASRDEKDQADAKLLSL